MEYSGRDRPSLTLGHAGGFRVARKRITSAQLKALNATAQTVVSAPSSGVMLVVLYVLAMKEAGTAYAGIAAGEDIDFRLNSSTGDIQATIEATGFLDSASATARAAYPNADQRTLKAAEKLVAHMSSGEITTGTGDLLIEVGFIERDFTPPVGWEDA